MAKLTLTFNDGSRIKATFDEERAFKIAAKLWRWHADDKIYARVRGRK